MILQNTYFSHKIPDMTKEQLEIKKLKNLAENEIVEWLSALSQLEQLDHYAKTTDKIKSAFKAVNKAENKRTVRKSRQVVK